MLVMRPIVVPRLGQTFRKRDAGLPAERGGDFTVVSIIVTNVDRLAVGGIERMLLFDRRILRTTVHLPGIRVNDPGTRIEAATDFQKVQLTPTTDFQVRKRVFHRIEVADLAGQIEDEIPVLDQCIHAGFIAHVPQIDVDMFFVFVNVEKLSTELWQQ